MVLLNVTFSIRQVVDMACWKKVSRQSTPAPFWCRPSSVKCSFIVSPHFRVALQDGIYTHTLETSCSTFQTEVQPWGIWFVHLEFTQSGEHRWKPDDRLWIMVADQNFKVGKMPQKLLWSGMFNPSSQITQLLTCNHKVLVYPHYQSRTNAKSSFIEKQNKTNKTKTKLN